MSRDLNDILNGTDAGEVEHRVSCGPSPFADMVHARVSKNNGRAPKPIVTVGRSQEFRRVEALPRRALNLDDVQDVTSLFAKPDGKMTLRPIQSAALLEAAMMNGGFFPLSCGAGKTLITLLLPTALDSENAVLIVPPQLKKQIAREIETLYSKHFEISPALRIIAYSEISSAKTADLLDQIKPDLLICDEAHLAKNRASARTKRISRYLKENPSCRFVALSGTITSRSLNDYSHLIEYALRKSSPLPRGYREVQDWAGALDVKPEYECAPGALLRFCEGKETPREGFRRRLIESQGVVASSENEIGVSLVVTRGTTIKMPPKVQRIYDEVKRSWSIEGDEFSDILTRTRKLKEIACGFYYRWAWPGGEPDYEWLEARSNWNKAVREKLKQSRAGLDSPLLLANAAERAAKVAQADSGRGVRDKIKAYANLHEMHGALWPQGIEPWLAWKAVKNRKEPPIEAIWLDDFLLLDLQKRATEAEGATIVWYEHRAVGERLAAITKWPLYGEGTDASASKEPIIIASIAVQGTGKNLQHFNNNLFASLPPNGTKFEQTIARTHRPGQLADTVTAFWYSHTDECADAMAKIQADAFYQQDTLGAPQKVLRCTHVIED